MSEPLHIVVLAAGKGTRMKSELPKVLHAVGGAPMIAHVLRAASALDPASTTVVVGHMAELVEKTVRALGAQTVRQEPQRGTAHALMQAEPDLAGATGTLVLVYGDVPLLSTRTLSQLVDHHRRSDAKATILTAHVENPTGYGRILRDGDRVTGIVEERDATPAEQAITEINSGIYAFDLEGLFPAPASHHAAERTGGVLPHRSRRHSPQRRRIGRRAVSGQPRRTSRDQQSRRARRNARVHARRAERIADGGGCHTTRPGHDVGRPRCRDRPGHGHSSLGVPRRPDPHWGAM